MGKRGPPDRGKTETVKQRRIDVYLPTLEAKDRWRQAAAGRGQKVSEMVFQLVEGALAPSGEQDAASAQDLVRRLEDAQAELNAQRGRNEELAMLKERLEGELEEYRAEAVLGEGLPKMDPRLVRLFEQAKGRDGKPRVLDASEVRRAMRVTGKDAAQARALHVALEALELHGLLKRTSKGWVWNGK